VTTGGVKPPASGKREPLMEMLSVYRMELLDYYDATLEEIERNHALALERDADGVHDMRVALKRMKAFFNLLGAVCDDFAPKESFRGFRKIAKKSGLLRDSRVQMELADEMNGKLKLDLSGYSAFLSKMEDEGYETFVNFSRRNPMKRLKGCRKIISRSLRGISPVRAETKAQGRFYNLRNNLIMAGREENPKEENLHKVRILSKEIHYTFEILGRCLHLFEDRTDFVKDIKRVHQILGKWHDYEVALDYVRMFLSDGGEETGDTPYNLLTEHILAQKRKLENKFRSVIPEFIEKAMLL